MACAHSQNASRAAIFAGHFGTKLVASLRDGWRAARGAADAEGPPSAWQDSCTASNALSRPPSASSIAAALALALLTMPSPYFAEAWTVGSGPSLRISTTSTLERGETPLFARLFDVPRRRG